MNTSRETNENIAQLLLASLNSAYPGQVEVFHVEQVECSTGRPLFYVEGKILLGCCESFVFTCVIREPDEETAHSIH